MKILRHELDFVCPTLDHSKLLRTERTDRWRDGRKEERMSQRDTQRQRGDTVLKWVINTSGSPRTRGKSNEEVLVSDLRSDRTGDEDLSKPEVLMSGSLY